MQHPGSNQTKDVQFFIGDLFGMLHVTIHYQSKPKPDEKWRSNWQFHDPIVLIIAATQQQVRNDENSAEIQWNVNSRVNHS